MNRVGCWGGGWCVFTTLASQSWRESESYCFRFQPVTVDLSDCGNSKAGMLTFQKPIESGTCASRVAFTPNPEYVWGGLKAHAPPSSLTPAAPTQSRVWCRAFRYPIAVDCFWTLPPAADSARPASVIATYRSERHSPACRQRWPGTLHAGAARPAQLCLLQS